MGSCVFTSFQIGPQTGIIPMERASRGLSIDMAVGVFI